jgi:hypothetical protein
MYQIVCDLQHTECVQGKKSQKNIYNLSSLFFVDENQINSTHSLLLYMIDHHVLCSALSFNDEMRIMNLCGFIPCHALF